MIASGMYHGATANKIRPIMIPAIAHLAWGVIDDSIHPGWDAAPRRLPGTPADARYARHHRNEQSACQIPPWHLRGRQTTVATRVMLRRAPCEYAMMVAHDLGGTSWR